MEGYENLIDADILIQALYNAGFKAEEIKMIAGENFLNLFRQTINSNM